MGVLPPLPPTSPGLGRAFRFGLAGLALLTMAACGGGGGGGTTTVASPVATSLTAASATPLYGGTFTLTPVYSAGTGAITYTGGSVTCPATGVASAAVTANWTGARVYTLTVTNSASATATTTATVTPQTVVVAAVSPATATLTVGDTQTFASSVTGAADATLTWQVDGTTGGSATVGTITTAGVYTAGTATGSHTISAVATADGTTKQSATVTVNAVVIPAPVATSLTPSSATPLYGATFTLTPVYSAGTGTIDNSVTCPATGVASAAITANWTGARVYTLTVTNSASVTATTTTTVTPQTVAVASVTPATPTLSVGGTATFASSVTGASDSVITWSVDSIAGGNSTVGTITSAGLYTAPATAGTHTITATAHANGTTAKSTTVTVVAGPAATSLVPSSATPLFGATFTLTPTYSGGTGTIDNSVTCPATGVASAAITASWTGARVYTLTVTNAANVTATTTATVTPQTVAVANVTPAAPTLSAGGTTTFASTVTGASDTVITWSVDSIAGGNSTVGTITSAGLYTAPAAAGTHTITATAHANGTTAKSTTVTIVAGPVATSLVPSSATPLFGATFTLTPTYSGGTGTIDNSVTCPATGVASAAITASWTGARVYTLTVTNAASATATATTTVTPQVVAVSNVSPATAYADANHTATFTSTVTGASDTTITWSVDSIAGGNATVGTITGGVYTAGSATGAHTITATAHANGTTSKTATVTVVALPTATSLAASSATPLYGATFTLTPTYTDGTGAIDNGVTCPATGVASAAITANFTSLTTYTLTVTNLANSTATAHVDVTPQAVVLDPVSPATATVTSGLTQVFTSSIAGASDSTINWSVDSIAGGNAAVGTITASGTSATYTAGTTSGAHTITATALANSATQTATVTVVAAPTVTSFKTVQGTFTPGATATLTAVFTNGTGGTAVVTPGNLDISSGSVTVTPAASTTYTLVVKNSANTQAAGTHTTDVLVGKLSVLAGTPSGQGNVDGNTVAAVVATPSLTLGRFWETNGIAQDASGNVYVSDYNNNCIRKIDTAGVITTPYGQTGVPGTSNGTGNSAQFFGPSALVIDGTTMYVADTWNNALRKIDLTGRDVTTVVTGGSGTFSFRQGNVPVGMVLSGTNLYIADQLHNVIKVYDTGSDSVSTLTFSDATTFNFPAGLAVIGTNLYVADMGNNAIKVVDLSVSPSTSTTLVTGASGLVSSPVGLATDGTLLYETDYETSQIQTITQLGVVTAVAGVSNHIGSTDADGTAAKFAYPTALFLGTVAPYSGKLLVADFGNNTLRAMTTASPFTVSTVAGVAGNPGGTADNTGTAATFQNPTGVVLDAAGEYAYVADLDNGAIRKIEIATGVTTKIADRTSTALSTFRPWSLALSGTTLYIADYGTGTVETLSTDGVTFNTLATLGAAGTALPTGIAVDATGTYAYVTDQGLHTVTRIAIAGGAKTTIGTSGTPGYDNTTGTEAFNVPAGLALSGTSLYIADQGNSAIRKLDTTTLAVSTYAGPTTFGHAGQADGDLATATFNNPQGIAVDAAGTLYVLDTYSDTVRMITAAGQVTTIAGLPGPSGRITGQMANIPTAGNVDLPATLAYPRGIAVLPTLTLGTPGIFLALPDGILKVTF